MFISLVTLLPPFHSRNGPFPQQLPEILENLAICTDTNPTSLCIGKYSEQIVAVCGKSSKSQTYLSRCLRTISTREATQLVEAVECAYLARILDLTVSHGHGSWAVHPAIGAAIIFTLLGANCLLRTYDMHMRATMCLRKFQNLRWTKCKTRGVARRTARLQARARPLRAAAFLALAAPARNQQDQAYATHTEAVLNFDTAIRECAADSKIGGDDTLPHRQRVPANIIVPSNIVLVLLDLAGGSPPYPGAHGNNRGESILSFDISTAAGRERWKNYVRLKMTDRGTSDPGSVSSEQ